MNDHPGYLRWEGILHRLLPTATAFHGTLYRACTPSYANDRDLLTGEGARKHGGRWNAPGAFSLVYLSMTFEGAIAETVGRAGQYGIRPADRLPLTLVAIEAALGKVLDMTHPKTRRALGVTLSAMSDCNWDAENRAQRECLTQALGRAASAVGLDGIIVPSAVRRALHNLNVFPQNLGKTDTLTILRADLLPPPVAPAQP